MKQHACPPAPEKIAPEQIRAFQKAILGHFKKRGRDLPWRMTADPYRILVSEVMLQQTQVERVLPKYIEFLRRFPDTAALASASLQQVLSAWSGLGYNRRAKALKLCAEAVMERHGGSVPRECHDLVRLPGIGPYTARAVRVFAFNLPEIVIETNIRSVYLHYFYPGQAAVRDSDLLPLIQKTLYRPNPRQWYNALMDHGAELKKSCLNPSRRSCSHARQSRFEGSNRQLRGKAIKCLLSLKAATEAALGEKAGIDPARLQAVLTELVAEGLLVKRGSTYSIP